MNSDATKKLLAITVTTLLLTGVAANAAETHKCKAGEHWDMYKQACVKDVKK